MLRSKMLKRVLIVATVGGFLQKFEMDDVRYLIGQGCEIHYAANPRFTVYEFDKNELQEYVFFHPVNIQKSPFQIRDHLDVLRELIRIIRTYDIRLVHCHTPVGGALGRIAARHGGKDVKVIYTAHGFHFYRGCPVKDTILYKTVERCLARYTDTLVVINREDYETASHFHLKAGGQVVKIPGVGLDRERFCPLSIEEKKRVRESLGIEPDQILLVTTGELNQNKNHTVVLDMICRMRERGDDLSGIRYHIFGSGPDREKLAEEIRERSLTDIVTMWGYSGRPEKIAAAADLFLFPSRREGLGMAALEALACGTPVIASDNRGTREYMQPEKNGYVCQWDRAEEFLAAFDQWRVFSPAERQKMREYSCMSAEPFDRKYSMEIMQSVYQQYL